MSVKGFYRGKLDFLGVNREKVYVYFMKIKAIWSKIQVIILKIITTIKMAERRIRKPEIVGDQTGETKS